MADDPRPHSHPTRRHVCKQLLVGATSIAVYPGQLAFSATRSCAAPRPPTTPTPPSAPQSIAGAAEGFVKSLTADQRTLALFAVDDDRRKDWHFVPKSRKGVPYKQLDPGQRQLADALVEAALGARGFRKFDTIRSLEPILREVEQGQGPTRDPELYYVSLFGAPRDSEPWGWSVEGHHVSLNFTMVGANRLSSTPAFLGANPAEVRHGARKGLRALSAEEDLARTLLASLDGEQRARAVVTTSAPSDILTGSSRKAEPLAPAGLGAGAMSGQQTEYANTMTPSIANARMAGLRAAGIEKIHFAWAGGLDRGQPHYYRVQGPSFLVEYDNTQNGANHVHTVWRDFAGDFGLDLLANHYEHAHK
jgi:hypothetical protein